MKRTFDTERAVSQFSVEGELVARFENAREAARSFVFTTEKVAAAARNIRMTAKNDIRLTAYKFYWLWHNEEHLIRERIKTKKRLRRSIMNRPTVKKKHHESLMISWNNVTRRIHQSDVAKRMWMRPGFKERMSKIMHVVQNRPNVVMKKRTAALRPAVMRRQREANKRIANDPFVQRKKHKTRQQNHTGVSQISIKFLELLRKFFPYIRNEECYGHLWAADFYISKIDTYIELDGVYWHGLDRQLCEIQASLRPIDKVIAATYDRDREKDAWFISEGKKLIRITDCAVNDLIKKNDASWDDIYAAAYARINC